MGIWEDKRVIVTGGAGFLGGVVDGAAGAGVYAGDLVPPAGGVRPADEAEHPAARTRAPEPHGDPPRGRGRRHRREPGEPRPVLLRQRDHGHPAHRGVAPAGSRKFVALGTICAYPKFAPVPFREEDLWNGYPEETNAPYGLAKKMMLVQVQAYRQQYGFNGIFLLPVNLYGPRDNFDPRTTHVIPAMIRKWWRRSRGDGEIVGLGRRKRHARVPLRRGCRGGIVLAAERYDGAEPVNLGAGMEISIRDLAS